MESLRQMIKDCLLLEKEIYLKEIAEKSELKVKLENNIQDLKSKIRNYEITKQKCIYENSNLTRMIKLLGESNDRYVHRNEEMLILFEEIQQIKRNIDSIIQDTVLIKKCISDEKDNINNLHISIQKMNRNISEINVSVFIFIYVSL